MKKLRVGLIVLSVAIFASYVFIIADTGWGWQDNKGSYIGMVVPVALVLSIYYSRRAEKKGKNTTN